MIEEPKQYYSERHGRGPKAEPLPLDSLRRLVFSVWDALAEQDFFHEAFGYECVDAGHVAGTVGRDPEAFFLRTLVRSDVWPYRDHQASYDADTLFDMIEVLHDLVSQPLEEGAHYHSYADCGWHYTAFNRTAGQERYRSEMNAVLRLCDPEYQLDEQGRLVEPGPVEFQRLLQAPVPPGTEHDRITRKIDNAVSRFQARGASLDDRHHAVRDLADVLEALRADIKDEMLPADDRALFQIANGFAIRHNNRKQRGDYDRAVWLRWAFYVYLATVHAVLRIRKH